MTTADIKRLGLILALQAEVEGMKAFNKQIELDGASVAYNEQLFNDMANQIRNIVHCHDDQL